jgi:hypothetical protein
VQLVGPPESIDTNASDESNAANATKETNETKCPQGLFLADFM